MTEKAMATKMNAVEITKEERAVVEYKGERITISFRDVKNLICPLATDQEVVIFLKTCQSLNLNPFASEVFLIKYSEKDKAAIVIAIDSYLKAGEANAQYDGHEAGIILRDSAGKLEYREGAFPLDEERQKLVGGWARVYRKDRGRPFYVAVNKKECLRYRRDGSLTEFWTEEKQPSMLRKVALKRALVEAFPSLFSGVVPNVDYEVLPGEVKEALPEPKGETPEGELPQAYEKNGKANWKLWWGKQKEKGLSSDDVHNILGISSLKDDWLDKGRTLEEAEDIISDALRQTEKSRKAGGTKPKPDWDTVLAQAKRLGLSESHVLGMLNVASLQEWTNQGKTVEEAIQVISAKLSTGKTDESAQVFAIDPGWLKEAKQTLKWTDQTMLSFIISQYKVGADTVTEALNKLTREQAEDFTRQINAKLERQSALF